MTNTPRSKRRIVAWVSLAVLVLLLSSAGFVGCLLSAPRFKGDRRAHFDGTRFINPDEDVEPGFFDLLKWQFNRDQGPWTEIIEAEPGPPPPERIGTGALRVTFVNHATVLIQMDGMNILTDPIWSERASPVTWAGPKRMRPPGIRLDDLPPIDAVLVSHNHYDHMDLRTLTRLFERNRPQMFVGLGNATILKRKGITLARDLDWWESAAVGEQLRVTFVPARHFSTRGGMDYNHTLWGGFVLEGPAGRVYYSGDTGFGPHFEEIGRRFGPIRMALLPIGAYRPRWFMAPRHISPAEAVAAHRELRAERSLAVHFGTFALGDDGQHEPVKDLRAAMAASGLSEDDFWVLGFGEGRDVPTPAGLAAGVDPR